MSGKAGNQRKSLKRGRKPQTKNDETVAARVAPKRAKPSEIEQKDAQSIAKAPSARLSKTKVPKTEEPEIGNKSEELSAVPGPSSRWVSYSPAVPKKSKKGKKSKTPAKNFKVLYTRIYELQLSESVKADRTATIIREDRGSDLVPYLHLLTVDLLKKADIDDTTRNNVAPDFKGILKNKKEKMLYYARFMKATQLFKMQNFPHLLKNHVENERAYYFGDLRRIENPNEMASNLDMITLADNNILVEVLVPN